jgi:hypothetical protein
MSDGFDIQADLFRQGLLDVNVDDVVASMELYRDDERYNPDFAYDPNDTTWEDEVYAPTAAEMEPDLAPPGWPGGR